MMCNTCGCLNYTLDELVWYRYQCSRCGHVYKSTGKKSVCPVCKSENSGKREQR
jgi:predicted Zn-ribbon and HTH transcriptional regulator